VCFIINNLKVWNQKINQKRLVVEIVGTCILVIVSAGPAVLNAKYAGMFGPWFLALCPAVGVGLAIRAFTKISMAHYNPAVTIGFLITKHMPRNLLGLYLAAEFIGAFLGILFVKYVIGAQANLGANAPNYAYPIPVIFGVEVLATMFVMGITLIVVHDRGHHGHGWAAVGAVIGLDIFFFGPLSGASMNPIRSMASAVASGYINDLWLYLTAPFVGTSIVAFVYKIKFQKSESS
jgi:aquaporin Z